jgi:predicted RNA binding protein YcfA (HicA-like mRNA interferase family)
MRLRHPWAYKQAGFLYRFKLPLATFLFCSAGQPSATLRAAPYDQCFENLQKWQVLRMKVSEMLKILMDDGWYLVTTRGSHRQFKHPSKPGRVTLAGKPSDDLAPGTLTSILKQSDLKKSR